MDWYKRYMGDYGIKTTGLNLAERGAYDSLLDEYYTKEQPLPKDKRELYRIVRAFERWERAAVDSVLAKFFSLTDTGYSNPRAEEELAKYKKAADIHRANGSRHTTKLLPNSNLNPVEILDTRYKKIKEKPSSAARKTKTSWPENFSLTEEMTAFASRLGISSTSQFDAFRDYHLQNGSKFLDWEAAWRTWCRRAVEFGAKASPSKSDTRVGAAPGLTVTDDQRRKMVERDREMRKRGEEKFQQMMAGARE